MLWRLQLLFLWGLARTQPSSWRCFIHSLTPTNSVRWGVLLGMELVCIHQYRPVLGADDEAECYHDAEYCHSLFSKQCVGIVSSFKTWLIVSQILLICECSTSRLELSASSLNMLSPAISRTSRHFAMCSSGCDSFASLFVSSRQVIWRALSGLHNRPAHPACTSVCVCEGCSQHFLCISNNVREFLQLNYLYSLCSITKLCI